MDAGMKLYPGAGKKRREGFIHTDIRPGVCPHVMDIEAIPWRLDGAVLADASVAHLFISHTVEHLSWRSTDAVLDEAARVLGSGGIIEIAVPHFRNILQWALGSRAFEIEHLSRIFGGQDYSENTHRTGFDDRSLARALWQSGFENIRTRTTPSGRGLHALATRRAF